MSSVEPKYRRPLNEDQITVLRKLYLFRFASADQLARSFNKPSGKYVQKRLRILEDQNYIAKCYDKSYKLQGKPAAYYLLPKAAKLLQTLHSSSNVPDQAIKNRYKDKTASDKFINHSLDIFSVFLQLKILYGDRLQFLTNANLNLERYDYFPKWLPNAYIILKGGAKGTGKQRQFFLNIFDENIPFFVRVRRVKSYLTYAQNEEWEGDELPTILMVCESPSTQKRLRRRIAKELDELWDDLAVFYVTTKQELSDSTQREDKIWELATDIEIMKSLGQM